MKIEQLSSEQAYQGRITVALERWRYDDGLEVTREIVHKDGAVAIVAHDQDGFYLVSQPREAVNEPESLELPAGTLDVMGEGALACARRELIEEIGMEAEEWKELKSFYPSPGFTDEQVVIFEATGLKFVGVAPEDNERIEIMKLPWNQLEATIAKVQDAKTLLGLMLLARSRQV